MSVPYRRWRCVIAAVLGAVVAGMAGGPALADDDATPVEEALSFAFIADPPGRMISLETHRLHLDCHGNGPVVVLFEPGLGGSAFEWEPVRDRLDERITACVYDRAGYAWSDPSPFRRDARQLAREADTLLGAAGLDGPLILVGHSFGGFVARQLAVRRGLQMIGLVLVDASHEDQFDRIEASGGRQVLPRGNSFVISASDTPENLPDELRRKVQAFARMRKTYAATHAELASFRQSAADLQATREAVKYPVRVLRRGRLLYPPDRKTGMSDALWIELQEDLATLNSEARLIVAEQSGHHVHVDQPALVADTIGELVDDYQTRR